jgi:hypothetical protein
MCRTYKKLFCLRLLGVGNMLIGFSKYGTIIQLIIGSFIVTMTFFIEDHRWFCSKCNPPKSNMEELAQMVGKQMFMDYL